MENTSCRQVDERKKRAKGARKQKRKLKTKGIEDTITRNGEKKSEKYWGQRQNAWAGAVIVGKSGNSGQGQVVVGRGSN